VGGLGGSVRVFTSKKHRSPSSILRVDLPSRKEKSPCWERVGGEKKYRGEPVADLIAGVRAVGVIVCREGGHGDLGAAGITP